jgi:serine phosphatase RsbU (regulator of sigma subunit)
MIVRGERIDQDRRSGDRRNRSIGGHVSLFRGVDLPELDRILADCPLLELSESRVLIRKGEKNEHLYILLSGELQVQLDLNDPSPIRIGPGETVGEISLIDGEPTSAYVVAKPGTRLIVVADHIFWDQIIPLPGVARNLMRAQTKRMRANNESILAKLQHELQLQQFEKDLAVAADIQRGMLPRRFPLFPDRREIDLHATMNPAREIGGDFYDSFLTDKGHLFFAVGDVSGKGVAAALFMVRSMTLLRTEARHAKGPLEMLERINRLLCEENPQSMFVTLCVGVLELDSGRVRIGNAGHLPPLIGAGGQWRMMAPSASSLLGVWESGEFAEVEFQLAAGQTIVLYSDGVTEAHAAVQSEQFGDERLLGCLQGLDGTAEQSVERIVEAVSAYASGDAPFDDITVLALRYNGLPR